MAVKMAGADLQREGVRKLDVLVVHRKERNILQHRKRRFRLPSMRTPVKLIYGRLKQHNMQGRCA